MPGEGSRVRTLSIETRGTDTRQRIIEAVWEVLAENGLPGLTVRLVGQKAGISHAMVHYYFTSKNELVLAVVEHARGYWIHPMEDIVLGPGSPLEKLETVVAWMAEPATRDVMRVHGQLLSQSEWNEDLRTAMAAEYARWRAASVELFRQLEEAETLTEDTDVKLLGAAFATLSDHLVDEQALDSSIDTEAIMREALRPFLRVPVKPTVGGAKRLPAAVRRPRPRRARRGR
jgi:AcrR family transcriptional regulator